MNKKLLVYKTQLFIYFAKKNKNPVSGLSKNSQRMTIESTTIKSTDKNVRCTINQLANYQLTNVKELKLSGTGVPFKSLPGHKAAGRIVVKK